MPPGPRLSSLPVLGNIFSLDLNADRMPDTFKRSVLLFVSLKSIFFFSGGFSEASNIMILSVRAKLRTSDLEF